MNTRAPRLVLGLGIAVASTCTLIAPVRDVARAAINPTPVPGIELVQPVTDMVYDEVHDLLYAVTPSNSPTFPQSLIAIDGFTWQVVKSVPVARAGLHVWLSSDAAALYVTHDGESAVRQYDTPTLAEKRVIGVVPPTGQSMAVTDVAVSRVDHDVIAVSAFATTPPGVARIAIFDRGVARPNVISLPTVNAGTLAWGPNGSTLYSNRFGGFVRMAVDSGGVSEIDITGDAFTAEAKISYNDDHLYDSTGRVVDAITGLSEGLLDPAWTTHSVAYDFDGDKAYLMRTTGDPTLRERDLTTHASLRESPTIKNQWPMQIVFAGSGYVAMKALHLDNSPSSVWLLAPGIFDGASGEYTSVTPTRILDTRDGTGRGGVVGPIPQNRSIDVQIAGVGGVPATNVDAVVLNATVTSPSLPGFLTVWPKGFDRPTISNVNFSAGQTIANLVTVTLGDGGALSVYNNAGSVHVVFDVAGYYDSGEGPRAQRFHSLAPQRLFDTRDGTGGVAGALGPSAEISFKVTGLGGVPSAGVTAIAMNVTVTEPTSAGYLTVYPSDVLRPPASNINFIAGNTVPNLVIVRVPASGIIKFFNSAGSLHVIADVVGYYDSDRSTEAGRLLTFVPYRWLDTREDSPFDGDGTMPPRSILDLGDASETASAYVLNVTVTEPTAPGYLTVYPDDLTRDPPLASNLNFVPGQTVPNLVLARTGPYIGIYNSNGFSHVIVDVFGWFT